MTPDVVLTAEEQARAAARLRGAAQALSVLQQRPPADQHRAAMTAIGLLHTHVAAADWAAAGLPPWPQAGQQGDCRADPVNVPVPVQHRAVLLLARTAMALHAAGLRISERPQRWARLADFFAARLPASDPDLVRLRERALAARVDAGETSPEVFGELAAAVDFHRDVHGEDGYLTSIARANLALAYRHGRTDTDLSTATALAEKEAQARADSYGLRHPATLAARSLFVLALLVQAETSSDGPERHRLASRALAEVTAVRAIRDRLYGVTSPNATMSRRCEARALLLLGNPERARASLEYALAFEKARDGGRETRAIADAHYHLARVHRVLGDPGKALLHARQAARIFTLHNPAGPGARQASALLAELS